MSKNSKNKFMVIKEEWFEEGGGIGDHHEEDGGEICGHHLAHDLSLQSDLHADTFCRVSGIDKGIIGDSEQYHV